MAAISSQLVEIRCVDSSFGEVIIPNPVVDLRHCAVLKTFHTVILSMGVLGEQFRLTA